MFEQIVGRPVAVFMLSVAFCLFGVLAYQELPIALMPPLDYPTLTIQAVMEGAAPEEIEIELTQKIEERVSTVEGLISLSSASRPGLSEIKLEFRWGEDLNAAVQRVLERIDRIELPKGADPPQVLRYDPTLEPLMVLAMTSDDTFDRLDLKQKKISELRHYAQKVLVPILQQVEGVAAVKVVGGLKEELKVDLDPQIAMQYKINSNLVAQKIQASQVNLAAGKINEAGAEVLVRSLSEIKNLEDLKNLMMFYQNQAWLKLKDLGQVHLGYAERQAWTSIGKNEAIRIQIYRQADGNLLKISRKLREQFDLIGQNKRQSIQFKARQPEQSKAYLLYDQSIFIQQSLDDLKASALLGGLLAILILYLFLRSAYQTLVIAIAIPLSLTLAFVPMNLFGISLNLMSLGGLALGIGMLVDNSVVVLENIDRCKQLGLDRFSASIKGVSEVGTAVIASTLTTVAVFLPVAFVDGVAGQIFGELALTVVCSLIASLIVAIAVVPVMSAYAPNEGQFQPDQADQADQADHQSQSQSQSQSWVKFPKINRIWEGQSRLVTMLWLPFSLPWYVFEFTLVMFGNVILAILALCWLLLKLLILPVILILKISIVPFAKLTHFFIELLIEGYARSLRFSLQSPLAVMVLSVLAMVGSWQLKSHLSATLLPDVSQGVFLVEAEYAVGTSLEETHQRMDALIDELQLLTMINHIELLIGKDEGDEMGGTQRASHQAQMRISLKDPKLEAQALVEMRQIFNQKPELKVLISQPSLFSLRPPIRIVFKSPDLEKLMQSNTLALSLISSIPEIKELKSTMSVGYPELQLFYDEARLKQYQLNPLDVAQQVKAYLAGEEALILQWGADLIPVVVRLSEQSRTDLEQFTIIQNGNQYPLSSLATWHRGVGPAQIYHTDAQRSVEISASVPADQLGLISDMITQKINQSQWPKGVEINLNGQDQEMNESLNQLLIALAISIFLVYVVMATQFESLIVPLLIMGTVPLAVIGVIWGLWISNTPISVVVAIALIILAGVVVNNAIVFLEKSQQNELEGLSKLEALIESGKSRLRPILMTTLTTLLGLLPMLWDEGEGAELRYPLALTLIAGLSVSTLLTLYVIPALYLQFTKISRKLEHVDETML